jgi:hypothetical protein
MNLNASPTRDQLRQLLAQYDDRAGQHVLWVDAAGGVHLSRLLEVHTADDLQQAHPDMRLRYETFLKGNEYVGPGAAEDDRWVSDLFDRLLKEWSQVQCERKIDYVLLW